MARLPTPGADKGNWGTILNDFLTQSLNSDGSLKDIPQGKVTNLTTDLAAKQPLDSDLTAIAGSATTAYGRSVLTTADAGALRTLAATDGAYAPLTGPFAPSMTGATDATRYVGGTASGAPTTGTYAVGDYIIDRSGSLWICVTAGTPGTWIDPGKTEVASKTDATTYTWVAPDNNFKIIPGLTDTSFLLARPHHVHVGAWVQSTASNGIVALGVFLDGVMQDYLPGRLHTTATTPVWISGTLRVPAPTAGQHTIDLRLNNYTGGTVTAVNTVNPAKMTIVRG